MLRAIDLPNLLNGVSRQPANLRLSSQAERQVNGVSDIVKGLRKRPGLTHLLNLTGVAADATFHVVNRDGDRRFLISATGTAIKAWNLNSLTPATVTNAVGVGYLSGTGTPRERLKMLTVADYTFVLNKQKVPAMTAANTGRPNYAAIIQFRSLRVATIRVYVNGALQASYATTGTPQVNLAVDNIRSQLAQNLGAGWSAVDLGTCVYLERTTGADFTITVDGGDADGEIRIIKERIQDFADLPYRGRDGMKIEVVGAASTQFDNFWVKYESEGSSESGVWVESNGHNLLTTLDNTLLPHALVVDPGGTTLTYQQLSWATRDVGDDGSAPIPSMVGRTISDIFFFRNRLGMLSDENVLFSESGEYFNLFPTTVTDLLDSDPIDIGTSHTKVSILKHAVPVAERCVLFSDATQFLDNIQEGDLLTPKTAAWNAVSEYELDANCPPVTTKQSVFFTSKNGTHVKVWEMFPESVRHSGEELAFDVTEHVPDYVTKNARRMQYHQGTNTLFILSDDQPNRLYVYRYLWQERKRVQASWSQWDFDDGLTSIADFFILDNTMYVVRVGETSTDYRLCSLDLSLQADETDILPYNVHLDNKTTVLGVYDAGNDWTTWTLPASWPTNVPFVALRGGNFGEGIGTIVQGTTRPTSTTVRATGDHTAAECLLGAPYTFLYEFSRFYIRDEQDQVVEDGSTMCKDLTLYLDDTGYLKATVTRVDRSWTYEMTGTRLLDSPLVYAPAIGDGVFRVPLHSKNENIRVVLESDSPYPLQITKARVVVDYVNVKRQV